MDKFTKSIDFLKHVQNHQIIEINKSTTLINKKSKTGCKILKFSFYNEFDEVLIWISKIKSQDFPNIFIFICEFENIRLSESNHKIRLLEKFLLQFDSERPLILQVISRNETTINICYKLKKLSEFCKIGVISCESRKITNFSSFLLAFFNQIKNFEYVLIKSLPAADNSSLILKFLNIFQFPDDFFCKMILKCAAEGRTEDFLAILDVPFNYNDNFLDFESQKYLKMIFENHFDPSINSSPKNTYSALYMSVVYSNQEIFELLTVKHQSFIQQLPFSHQIEISTASLFENKFKFLCDLLEFCDFPFPLDINLNSINDERLRNIVDFRQKFFCAITSENLTQMAIFINSNPKLKIVYNLDNISALKFALESKKFKSFCYLRHFGFQSLELDNLVSSIMTSKCNLNDFILQNRMQNNQNLASVLTGRSFIYTRDRNKEMEANYYKTIYKWYVEISNIKHGRSLLDAVIQCEDLKIIFDFEYDCVSI